MPFNAPALASSRFLTAISVANFGNSKENQVVNKKMTYRLPNPYFFSTFSLFDVAILLFLSFMSSGITVAPWLSCL